MTRISSHCRIFCSWALTVKIDSGQGIIELRDKVIGELARKRGPVRDGFFRVITIEADSRTGCRDFESLEEAKQYADDAAFETESGSPVAVVLE